MKMRNKFPGLCFLIDNIKLSAIPREQSTPELAILHTQVPSLQVPLDEQTVSLAFEGQFFACFCCEQSKPVQLLVSSHTHCPISLQYPFPEHTVFGTLVGHVFDKSFRTLQASPSHASSHSHVPLTHCPFPLQSALYIKPEVQIRLEKTNNCGVMN